MKWIALLAQCHLLVTVLFIHLEAACVRWHMKDAVRNACYTSDRGPSATQTSESLSSCALQCITSEHMVCVGANYVDEFSRCELYGYADQPLTVSHNCHGHYLIRLKKDQALENPIQVIPNKDMSAHNCGMGWVRFGGFCYMLKKSPEIFLQADVTCQSYTGYLVSIHSVEENQFISWLARYHLHGVQHMYIGLIKHEGNKVNPSLLWTDATAYDFKQWSSGQPDRIPRDAVCVYMDVSDGTWGDGSCGEALPYVCKKPVAD